jgi:hypothetical protein
MFFLSQKRFFLRQFYKRIILAKILWLFRFKIFLKIYVSFITVYDIFFNQLTSIFDLVQMFLQDQQPLEVQRLIDADNELIRQDKEKPTTLDILADIMEKTIKNYE